MQEQQNDLFKKILTVVGSAFVFLFPFAFSTITSNVFDIPKKVLLFTAALVALALWAIRSFVKKKVSLALTPFTLPLIAFSLAGLISAFFTEGHFVANLYGKAGVLLGFTIIFLVLTTFAWQNLTPLLSSLIGAGFILSWVSIFAYLEFLPKFLPWPMISSKAFSPLGPPLASACFLAVVLPVTFIVAVRTREVLIKTVLFAVSAVQAVALIFLVSLMLPGQSFTPTLLPFSAGWSITVDMLKSAKSAIVGVGPDNFVVAYTRFKPVFLNADNLWAVRFAASSNELLTIATTMGALGLFSFLWLLVSILKAVIGNANKARPEIKLGLGLTLLAHLLIPGNLVVWFLTFVFLSLAGKDCPRKVISLKGVKVTPLLPKLVNLIMAAFVLVGLYALSNFTRADLAFAQSLKTAAENKGTETYNLQIKALQLNPYELRYRLAYSNTNLALANSLAGKEDISDEDKKNISQLVSQSIREAKAAVALNPKNVASWENLATIYRNLINFAQGADKWATASYIEAVKLDPINPRLRLDFGGLFHVLTNYDQALDQFKRAAEFKPNYANAYYNLSAAYRAKGDNANAFLAMQRVVELIDKESQDFDKASLELAELRKLLPEDLQTATAAAKRPGELTKPQPLPQPAPDARVNFPPQERENLAPPPTEEEGNSLEEATSAAQPTPEGEEPLPPEGQ